MPRAKLRKSPAWRKLKWVRICLENVDSEARDSAVSTLVAAPISRAETVEAQTTGVEKGLHSTEWVSHP